MTITTHSLTRAAAVAAVAAGVVFIGVQIGHPHLDADSITTTEVVVRNSLKVLMCALALVGITGMYLSQVRRNGVLGLAGYLLFGAGYLLIMSTTAAAAFVLPQVVDQDRGFVSDMIEVSTGGSAEGDLGALSTVLQLQGGFYLLGGLLFGIALFRAGVLARWACVLLAVSGLVSAALTVMPDVLPAAGLPERDRDDRARLFAVEHDPDDARHRKRARDGGCGMRIPVAVTALVAFPLVAGTLRIVEVAGGPAVMPDNPRTEALPIALVLHVLGAAVYGLVGSFQFVARIRRTHRAWHRRAGRVLVVAGLVVAGSGLWLTLFSTDAPGGGLLWAVRLVVGSAMASIVVLGFAAIRRRDIRAHRAWMIRAYALALAAGTQMFTQGVGEAVFGSSDLSTALSISAGWLVNAAVAEWVVRRPGRLRGRRPEPLPASVAG